MYRDDLSAARSRLAQLEQERRGLPDEPALAAVQRQLQVLRAENARLRWPVLPAAVVARLLGGLILLTLVGFDLVMSFGRPDGVPPLFGLASGWLAAAGAFVAVFVIGLDRPHWLVGLGGLGVVGGVLCDKPYDAPIRWLSAAAQQQAFLLPGLICLGGAIGFFIHRLLRRG